MFSFITSFFNDFLFTLIIPGILLGVALLVAATFIPTFLTGYKVPVQVLGLVLVVFFVFQTGRSVEVNKNAKAVLEAEAKIAKRETASEKVNTETIIRYVDRVQVVNKIKEVPTNVYVTKETDRACSISAGDSLNVAIVLNDSVRGIVPRSPGQAASSAK